MSSSSATATTSRSPSPASPASSDSLDTVAVEPTDLSSWYSSIQNDKSSTTAPSSLWEDISSLGHISSKEEDNILSLDDLIQSHVYEDLPLDNFTSPLSNSSPAEDMEVSLNLEQPPELTPKDECLHPTTTLPAPEHVPQTKPIPPPTSQPRKRNLSATSQNVVYPPKDMCENLPVVIPSIPPMGTKSRVETQVRVTVDLAHASSSSGQYDRVGSWKWLRLPKGTATKKRTRKEGKIEPTFEDTLQLVVEVTCASVPHMRVHCCSNCQNREAKRVARKIAARVRPSRSDSDSRDADDASEGKSGGRFNIIQFNCPQVLDYSTGSAVLPLRITCYCRHHKEKVGFNVRFTMLDHQGRVVGSGISPPIMITDDHKSNGALSKSTTNAEMGGEWSLFTSQGDIAEPIGPAKRKLVDTSEQSKKRVKSTPGSRVLSKAYMATSPSASSSTLPTRTVTPQFINSGPPTQFINTVPSTPAALDNFIFQNVESFIPPTSNSVSSANDDSGVGSEDQQPQQGQFALNPAIQRAMSPPSLLTSNPSSPEAFHQPPLAAPVAIQPMPFMFFHADPPPVPNLPKPKIHRLIPSSGPTYGGVEVTILGSNFHSSIQLDCLFGDVMASSTQRWSDNTLVCILPPRICSGVVAVWFRGVDKEDDGTPPCLFTYTDESDRALMELALQVVGLKMTGKLEDAKSVAMRIVGPAGDTGSDSNSNVEYIPNTMAMDLRALVHGSSFGGEVERLVIKLLSLLDVNVAGMSPMSLAEAVSHQSQSGQTLLHFATFLRFPALIRFLIQHEIDLDIRDKNGYTALHVAGFIGARDCAKILVESGADTEVVDALGKLAQESASFDFDDLDNLGDGESVIENDADEDESRWGDGEEDSEDDVPIRFRQSLSRRTGRTVRRGIDALSPPSDPSDEDVPYRPSNAVDLMSSPAPHTEKVAAQPPVVVDEKQAASFMETIHRTLARVQATQGIMPHLPLPHLPNLPGMPGVPWPVLNQIPMVFPVYNAWPTFLGDAKHEGQPRPDDEQSPKGGAIRALASPQEWKAFWEKWMIQGLLMQQRAVGAEVPTYDPPPIYTPRSADNSGSHISSSSQSEAAHLAGTVQEDILPVAGSSNMNLVPETERPGPVIARRLEYEPVKLTDQEVNAYEYRPAKPKMRQLQKKEDRMLVLFWIPILALALLWLFFHGVRFAVHSVRSVSPLKAILRM